MTRGRLNRRVGFCAALAAALIAGCGGGNSSSQSDRAVNLSMLAPTDGSTVSVRSLEVVGSVSPHNAVVSVAGRPAAVQGGVFRAPLKLSGPITHITVAATASGYASSSTGITVHYTAPGGAQDNASSGGASYFPPPSRAVLLAQADRLCAARNQTVAAEPALTPATLVSDTGTTATVNTKLVSAVRGVAGEGNAGHPLIPFTTGIQSGTSAARTIAADLVAHLPDDAQQFFTYETNTEHQLDKDASALGLPSCSQTALTLAGSSAALQQMISKALAPPKKKKPSKSKTKLKSSTRKH
jgi:Glucodextranase, domain B